MHGERTQTIVDIISRMGFKEELGGPATVQLPAEFAVVQDADRLDAIGAIGIGRTFTFGGAKNRPMHVPGVPPRVNLTKEQYTKEVGQGKDASPTINHFHEKLLKLKDLMKSEAGRKRAEGRHQTMVDFLDKFHAEWEGLC